MTPYAAAYGASSGRFDESLHEDNTERPM